METGVSFALARTRAVVAFVSGLAAFGVATSFTPWQAAVMVGWSVLSAVIVAWTLLAVWSLDGDGTAALATRADESRAVGDVLLTLAAIASLVSIGFALVKAGQSQGMSQAVLTALAILTVVLSWAMVHVIYTLRYAHLYYSLGEGDGIDFNNDPEPDYHDFAYVAFTIGMTFQVSDTNLTAKPIRRAALRHALLSYLFGVVVIAMAINGVAGLLNR
jgi:uncharacterized membrane protein